MVKIRIDILKHGGVSTYKLIEIIVPHALFKKGKGGIEVDRWFMLLYQFLLGLLYRIINIQFRFLKSDFLRFFGQCGNIGFALLDRGHIQGLIFILFFVRMFLLFLRNRLASKSHECLLKSTSVGFFIIFPFT